MKPHHMYFLSLKRKFEKELGRRLEKQEKELVDEMVRKQWRENIKENH
ncbi:hypothetical protein SAMN05192534_107137 [Alteribacillus persepolensis]|uniref:Uncharacterized protein n=1 Tax=Alteribacillus persepolensis TaxID=568899 RepID=A0A1G8DLG4_9BACI|nr:hypothetical protein [Alteribacillus persepolensis]SDH58544.1 hypothetical protein SAMN05192534_107137 [Alteribacillus persepolensis]